MQLDDTLRDIRKRCRMAMNGIASTSMREKGVSYKLNFGLVIQQIKEIAGRNEADEVLAEALWKEDTRELKIMATLLYPADKYTESRANEWVLEIPNQEMREQICLNLFQKLPFAQKLGSEWSNSQSEEVRTTGYWLLARLILARKINNLLSINLFSSIWEDIFSENIFLRNAALLILKHAGRQSKDQADAITERLSVYKDDSDLLKSEVYNSLAFEFEFFFG